MLNIDSQYFTTISEIFKLRNNEIVQLDVFASYQKHSFSNRTFLVGSQGLIDLSIPIIGGRNQKQSLSNIRIDHSFNWRVNHWRTIESCYRRSPWFEYYIDGLKPFFESEYELLWTLNYDILKWTLSKLNMKCSIEINYESPLIEIKNKEAYQERVLPKNYLEVWKSLNLKSYPQVFMERVGFFPNLSSLDLLFCIGPQAGNYLKSSNLL